MTFIKGATWRSAEPNEEADDGSTTETFLGVVHLETIPKGSIKVVEIELQLSRAGQLRLAAQLEYDGHDQVGAMALESASPCTSSQGPPLALCLEDGQNLLVFAAMHLLRAQLCSMSDNGHTDKLDKRFIRSWQTN